jgi:hypothetical protein
MNLLSDLRKEVHLQPCDLVIHRSTNPATESRIVPENAGSRFISSAGRNARPEPRLQGAVALTDSSAAVSRATQPLSLRSDFLQVEVEVAGE